MTSPLDVVWLGHATADVRLGRTRILTDPVLRDRLAHLRRHAHDPALRPGPVDAVVISHLHHDHLDLPSLRLLPADTPLIVPRGAGRLVARSAPGDVIEVVPGDTVVVGDTEVTAVPADHHPGRFLSRAKAQPLGFVFGTNDHTVYFPGDTDLHPVMADLPAPDVALLPIWGWGRSLGSHHLDPERAARAATMLRARSVLPVHWGTFAPVRARRGVPAWFNRPAARFRTEMERHAPDTELHLVAPGPDAVRLGRADGVPRRDATED